MTDEEYEVWLTLLSEVGSSKNNCYKTRASREMVADLNLNLLSTIPHAFFEITVRAQNCLKSANIHSIGDLVQKDFNETILDGSEVEAKTTQLGDMEMTVYRSKDTKSKVQAHAEAGDDDILGAITDMLVHDLKRSNFTFRHDVEKHSNCFPYIMLERYEETVVPVKPKRIHRRIATFVVTLGSNEATAEFELTAEEAIFLGKEHRKKYPKRLLDSKSWPRQEPPTILNRIYTKVQDAVVCLEMAYSVENRDDKVPPPNDLSEPYISH